ncbi:MAG: ATP-binding protein [Methanolinea sp.]|jgi:lon-related putative ATP-dependent protease
MVNTLPLEQYRKRFDTDTIECRTTKELEPLREIVGQKRALSALMFGLNIDEKGFNVFVSGMHGTGRLSAVCKFIQKLAKTKPPGNDWIYVNSFDNPYQPNAIRLPNGMGKQFKEDMAAFIREAKRFIPMVFESEDYASRHDAAIREIENEKAQSLLHMDEVAKEKGFLVQPGPQGLLTIPLQESGEPYQQEEFIKLPPEVQMQYQKRKEELLVELRNTFRQMRDLDKKGGEAIEELNRDVVLNAIGHRIASLKDTYEHVEEINDYIDSVQKDIIEHIPQFMPEPPQPSQPSQVQTLPNPELLFRKYEINVIVDNSGNDGAPVIFDQNPSYLNLFGKIEKELQYGVVTTDFTMIRPGSIHRANAGFLVLMAEDLFRNAMSWEELKTTLKTGKIIVEEPAERMGFISTKGIKPEPIPLFLKVIIIGTPEINQILYTMDPDFQELFKVRADFDTTMERTDENVRNYASFICGLCEENNYRHMDKSAVAKIIEFGSRLAEDQGKLTTRFSTIADIIAEASYYAKQDNADFIMDRHVKKALDERIYRSNLIQEKIQEYITKGIFLIDIEGKKAGQVNGLAVIGLGDIAFGRPDRVTASIGIGRGGIIDIEREAAMGGPIHTKGVLILSGFLNERYARDKPLALSARLVFEQSYQGVEGDSASSTELYALLSAISGIPINQAIAVTGSVNQKGEVQAIGGVNEKIEGYYEVCRAKGLTGEQGVMIPTSNIQNLMLKDEIIDAARAGKFTIYPVSTIDEGIEVLTGMKAGKRKEDGSFEEGSVNSLVDLRLREMAETMREYHSTA